MNLSVENIRDIREESFISVHDVCWKIIDERCMSLYDKTFSWSYRKLARNKFHNFLKEESSESWRLDTFLKSIMGKIRRLLSYMASFYRNMQ